MGEQRERQRIKSRVDEFPDEIRAQMDGMLADVNYTYQEIADTLTEQGYEISRSAVGRYAMRHNSAARRLKEAREQTTALLQQIRENQDVESTELASAILIDGLTRRIATAEEDFDALPLDKAGRLLVQLQRSTIYKERWRKERLAAIESVERNVKARMRQMVQDDPDLLERLQVETHFENGYRVTDQTVLETAEMALSARVNKSIVAALDRIGAKACGISGRDGGLITARQKDKALGLVGTITKVDPRVLRTLLEGGFLPVVSPVSRGEDGGALNCNADDAARAVAEAVGADKLIFLTDTDGILVDSHNQSTRIAKMDVSRAKELMDSGLIAGGMIPKTLNCIHAVEHGVGSVTVLDGRMEHAILLEAISEKSLGTTMEKKR